MSLLPHPEWARRAVALTTFWEDVFMDKHFFNVIIPKGHKLTEYLEIYENKNEKLLQIELLTL